MLSPLYKNRGLKSKKHCSMPSKCKFFKKQNDRSERITKKVNICLISETKLIIHFEISNFKYIGIITISNTCFEKTGTNVVGEYYFV